MVVPYKTGAGSFVAGTPRQWSPHSFADTGVLPNFDVAPDGERVIALMPAVRSEEQQTVNHVAFMLNFSEEVRRRTRLDDRPTLLRGCSHQRERRATSPARPPSTVNQLREVDRHAERILLTVAWLRRWPSASREPPERHPRDARADAIGDAT